MGNLLDTSKYYAEPTSNQAIGHHTADPINWEYQEYGPLMLAGHRTDNVYLVMGWAVTTGFDVLAAGTDHTVFKATSQQMIETAKSIARKEIYSHFVTVVEDGPVFKLSEIYNVRTTMHRKTAGDMIIPIRANSKEDAIKRVKELVQKGTLKFPNEVPYPLQISTWIEVDEDPKMVGKA